MPSSAVVFAYHNVGVRCLSVLLDHNVDVALVVTHEDSAGENIWFESVAKLARIHRIPVITPPDPNVSPILEQISQLRPDFLFSFYYRSMLTPALLRTAARGAFNMHGSLLPKYRGRVPVNWAIIKGEKETGATLHEMVEKPDAGRIADQQAVPILENDTALDVFSKVTVAAETVLHRTLPKLVHGTAQLTPQNLAQGSYFGGRKPEDGIINWQDSARNIHNLVRAVAPPYPGASTNIAGHRINVLQTVREKNRPPRSNRPCLYAEGDELFVDCVDGGVLRIVSMELNGQPVPAEEFRRQFGLAVELV